MLSRYAVSCLLIVGLQCSCADDGLPKPVKRKVNFEKDIEPILDKHCYECHGPDRQRGGLRLDERDAALRGSEEGKVIIPGKSDESVLIHLVAETDKGDVMPPKGKALSDKQLALLRAWIDQGAKYND